MLWLVTGLHTGGVGFVAEVHEEPPALDPAWEDVVEVSFRPVSERTSLVEWRGEAVRDLGLARTHYRVRYCARGMDEGRKLDTRGSGEPQADSYLLQFWPAPPSADRVVRQTSQTAAAWHRYARGRAPLPPPEQRAEVERRARQATERAVEERRSHRERWEWGGRLPSARLRGVGGHARELTRFDSDLVHALGEAGGEVRRAVAVLAARLACGTAGLIGVPWVVGALAALTRRRPLPPPFDDTTRLWETLNSDPRVPRVSVLEAVPPERPPYRPPAPPAATGWTWVPAAGPVDAGPRRPGLGRALGALVPTAPADVAYDTAVVHADGTARGPRRISQPHCAVRAVLAAADPDPLRAALDAVWHAVGAYGEHYPHLLEEVRSACAGQVEE
ncbi:hypothetical protein [Streptomyces mangrovisoli]|uniref:hypothetical protein n=1 Tax=Streptomyces mangrovisoli TaxID=1428628 RepID=UPI0030B85658